MMIMVESIRELREICQKDKTEYWRNISIYLTKLFLYTPITANQISAICFILTILSAIFISIDNILYPFLGLFLLYLAIILDHVDGEVARYKKQSKHGGYILDITIDNFRTPIIFVALTFNIYYSIKNIMIFVVGFYVIMIYFLILISYLRTHQYLHKNQVIKGFEYGNPKIRRFIIWCYFSSNPLFTIFHPMLSVIVVLVSINFVIHILYPYYHVLNMINIYLIYLISYAIISSIFLIIDILGKLDMQVIK